MIIYHFCGPIPAKGKFTAAQIERIKAVAHTLGKRNLPEGLEGIAFQVLVRLVLNVLIHGSDQTGRPPAHSAPGHRQLPTVGPSRRS
jgi:hypothetical protein